MSTDSGSIQPVTTPLRSDFSDDHEMADLIAFFVDAMEDRADSLRRSLEECDMGQLSRLTRQLKGVAPGYGFSSIGDSAAVVEALLLLDPGGQQIDTVTQAAEELIALCSRASS